jgi:phage shock protein E
MRIYKSTAYVLALLSISLVAACGGSSGTSDTNLGTQPAINNFGDDISSNDADEAITDDYVLIDVRTVEEFAEGHLEGALNLNVEDGTLAEALAGLDPNDTYQVYCRSGRRSAVAYDLMTKNGFTNVTDLGSVAEAAAATGLPVIS